MRFQDALTLQCKTSTTQYKDNQIPKYVTHIFVKWALKGLKGSLEINPTKYINEIAKKILQKHFECNYYSILAKPKQT